MNLENLTEYDFSFVVQVELDGCTTDLEFAATTRTSFVACKVQDATRQLSNAQTPQLIAA